MNTKLKLSDVFFLIKHKFSPEKPHQLFACFIFVNDKNTLIGKIVINRAANNINTLKNFNFKKMVHLLKIRRKHFCPHVADVATSSGSKFYDIFVTVMKSRF